MAARRARERRRSPTERRYRFVPAPAGADGAADDAATSVAELEAGPRSVHALAGPTRQSSPARGAIARQAPRPFSEYGADYAYVIQDLRRIALVVGAILLLIVVLAVLLGR